MEHYIPPNEIYLHKQVVQESAGTYSGFANSGYVITPNPLTENRTSMGGINKLYPDIIMWKPNSPDSNKGTAVQTEVIETPGSVSNEQNIGLWRKIGEVNVSFTLVVPLDQAPEVLSTIKSEKIRVSKLQGYLLNKIGSVEFYDIPIR